LLREDLEMVWIRATLIALLLSMPVVAQVTPPAPANAQSQTLDQGDSDQKKAKHGDILSDAPDWSTQIDQLKHALARLPIIPAAAQPRLQLVGRKQRPGEAELVRNPRARSALLRVAERRA